MFQPVNLVSPDGCPYTARTPRDLNDRLAQGYQRYFFVPPRPRPVTPVVEDGTDTDIDD